jgi:hypothetical protein
MVGNCGFCRIDFKHNCSNTWVWSGRGMGRLERSCESQVSLSGVGVEKVVFFKNRLKLGDRKCLPDPRRSFIAHPDAFYFCEFREKEFFNSHRRLH